MDGAFLDLNGEGMETEVDELFRESFKMHKSLQQRQKKADQEQDKQAGGGRAKQKDQGKPENPILHMCSRVLEQIQEFKVTPVPICQEPSTHQDSFSSRLLFLATPTH